MKNDSDTKSTKPTTAYERWELPVIDDPDNRPGRGQKAATRSTKQAEVKPPTAAELESIREAAYQEGLQQGLEEGRRKGAEEGRQQGVKAGRQEGLRSGQEEGRKLAQEEYRQTVEDQLKKLQQVADELMHPIRQHQDDIEEALLNLTLAISRAVIFHELQLNREQIGRLVHEALAMLPRTDEQVDIYLHPQDLEFLQTHMPPESPIRYRQDSQVLPGGCRVETRHTLLDYTVEKRFQAAVQQMLSRLSDEHESEDSHDYTDQMGGMSDFHRDVLEAQQTGQDSMIDKPESAEQDMARDARSETVEPQRQSPSRSTDASPATEGSSEPAPVKSRSDDQAEDPEQAPPSLAELAGDSGTAPPGEPEKAIPPDDPTAAMTQSLDQVASRSGIDTAIPDDSNDLPGVDNPSGNTPADTSGDFSEDLSGDLSGDPEASLSATLEALDTSDLLDSSELDPSRETERNEDSPEHDSGEDAAAKPNPESDDESR